MIYVAIGTAAYVLGLVGICALCRAAFLGDGSTSEPQRDAGSVPLPHRHRLFVYALNATRRAGG